MILHQATAVAIKGQALVIEGPPGSGKSSLALALLDRGAVLIGDDGIALRQHATQLLASPAPATAGLIEVRNVGLFTVETAAAVPIALVLRLDPHAPRYVEAAEQVELAGTILPLIRLFPESPVLALRAELALSCHGLG
jgi:serine kinase of HPr protein (carbohydrate metabolism regulator)